MELIPAIDLLNGSVVRLYKGDFEKVTNYSDDPISLVRDWVLNGAKYLHVVDLEGSRSGEPREAELVSDLFKKTRIPIQVAGGIRSVENASQWLDAGASAVVIGTLAVKEPGAVGKMAAEFGPERVIAAVDVRVSPEGATRVAISGWTEDSGISAEEALQALAQNGIRRILCTDIGRDGTKEGPNEDLYRTLLAKFPEMEIQASGGVGSVADLTVLKVAGVKAAIVGRALLDGSFGIDEALAC